MRVAIIGSRDLRVDIAPYIPANMTELVSGGARGIDRLAEAYADAHGIPKRIIRPDYGRYGRGAPLRRNREIVDCADCVIALWDGVSRGTQYTIDYARRSGKPVRVHRVAAT
jgi:hypothetical protein